MATVMTTIEKNISNMHCDQFIPFLTDDESNIVCITNISMHVTNLHNNTKALMRTNYNKVAVLFSKPCYNYIGYI